MTRQQILRACMNALALMVIMGGVVYFNGDPVGVSVQKALMVPVFWFSIKGLRVYFPPENDATRSVATQIKYEFLKAFMVAILATYWGIPYASVSLQKVVSGITVGMIIFAAGNLLLFWLDRRSGNHKNSPQ